MNIQPDSDQMPEPDNSNFREIGAPTDTVQANIGLADNIQTADQMTSLSQVTGDHIAKYGPPDSMQTSYDSSPTKPADGNAYLKFVYGTTTYWYTITPKGKVTMKVDNG